MGMRSKVGNLISEYRRLLNSNSTLNDNAAPKSQHPRTTTGRTGFGAVHTLYSSLPSDQEQPEVYDNLQRTVGVGNKSSVGVWQCRSGDHVVAVKQFCQRLLGETRAQQTQRVALEFHIGKTLHHGNVIRVIDLIQARKQWFQVMEYAPYDLFEAVKTRTMSPEEINCVFRQIIDGIAYVHGKGFAHRDMKLDNIMLSQQGIVKIIDFGCAVPCESSPGRTKPLAHGLIGSRPYIAPEMFRKKYYDPQAVDVWSVAIIFCVMTFGRFPWAVARQDNAAFYHFALQNAGHAPVEQPYNGLKHGEENEGNGLDHSQDANKIGISALLQGTTGSMDMANNPSKNNDNMSYQNNRPPLLVKMSDFAGRGRQDSLLNSLPVQSRTVIAGMLKVNPCDRFDCQSILEDHWIKHIPFCYEDGNGTHHNIHSHNHTLCIQ